MDQGDARRQIMALVDAYFRDKKGEKLPVHYAASDHDQEEAKEIIGAVLDGWWTHGKRTEAFEKAFRDMYNSKYSIFCNSGSSALIMAFESLKLEKGSEVVAPALSFPTSINPAIRQGMKIALVDNEPGTYNMDADEFEKAVTGETKALIIPHIMGNITDMRKVMRIADENGICVIEDCCEAIGTRFDGKMAGTFGVSSCFSFFPSHHISAGGGGIMVTNDDDIYAHAMSIKHWGRRYASVKDIPSQAVIRSDYVQQYTYDNLGYNFLAGELMAAKGLVQLRKLEKFNRARERNFETLMNFFKKYEDIFILPASHQRAEPSWFAFPLTIKQDAGFARNDIMEFLFKKKIEARHVLGGNIMNHPAYSGTQFRVTGDLRNVNTTSTDSFFIGIYSGIDEEKMNYMKESFEEFLSG